LESLKLFVIHSFIQVEDEPTEINEFFFVVLRS